AAVKIAPISRAIVAYGAVVAQPGNVRILSAAFEARVDNVLVAAGHPVGAGADVIEIEPSLDAVVGIAEAKNSLAAAQRDLKQTEQRFADHLATNSELSQAQQTLQSAQLKLDSLVQRGAGAGSQKLKSPVAGIISKIDVQDGQIVAAGAPLVEI